MKKIIIKLLVISILLLITSGAGCAKNYKKIQHEDETKKAPVGGNVILIEHFAFDPPVITIYPGETVIWENMDDVPHTVGWEGFESKKLDYLEEFKYIFREKGTYLYKCNIHPGMEGKIIVK